MTGGGHPALDALMFLAALLLVALLIVAVAPVAFVLFWREK